MSKLGFRGDSLYYGPINKPRPYSDITEKCPYGYNYVKSIHYALGRGFRDLHKENYGSDLEPYSDPIFHN